MRVLYVVRHLSAGGSITLVSERIRRLAGHGIDISVAAISPSSAKAQPLDRIAEWYRSGVDIVEINHISRRTVFRSAAKLRHYINGIDVVHVVNGPPSIPVIAAKWAQKPLILDIISSKTPRQTDRALRWAADVNLAVSKAAAEAYAVPRTRVIYPPIDLPPSSLDIGRRMYSNRLYGGRSPTVLLVTRLAKLDAGLISFARKMRDQVPNVAILVAGDGPNRTELDSAAHASGVADNLHFLGFRSDISELHAAADVYISLSTEEGLVGYATLEAAALSTPIVATDIPAVSEILRNNNDAILVPPGDMDAAVGAVSKILHSTVLANRLRHSASDRIRETLDPDVSAVELLKLYRSLSR